MDKIAVVLNYQILIRWRKFINADSKSKTVLLFFLVLILTYRYFQFCNYIANQVNIGHSQFVFFHLLAIPLVLLIAVFFFNSNENQILKNPLLSKCMSNSEFTISIILSYITSPIFLWSCSAIILGALKIPDIKSPLGLVLLLNYIICWFFVLLNVKYIIRLYSARIWILLFIFVFVAIYMNIETVIAFGQSVISSKLMMQKENNLSKMAILIGSISLLSNFVLIHVFANIAKRYKNHYKKEKSYRTGIKILKGEFPTKYGYLIKKEINDRFHLLDVYIVMVLSIYYGSYLIAEKNISSFSFYFYVSLSLALVFNSFCNTFGSETVNGIERYKLLPIKGKELLLLKNGIIFTIYTISVFPNMVLYFIRCGGKHLLFGMIGYLLQMFLYFMFGNRISINYPRKNIKFKMSSMTSTNYVFNSFLGLAIIIVSNVLILNAERIEPFWGIGAALLLLSIVLFSYRYLIEVQGKSLEHCIRFDKIYCIFENT